MKFTFYFCLIFVAFSSFSSEPIQLQWNALNSNVTEVSVDLPEVSDKQQRMLKSIIMLSSSQGTKEKQQVEQLRLLLEKEGVDADTILAQREQYMTEMKNNAETVTTEFDGKSVRMPGFIVPIEFDEKLMATEFLLVPVAGACIHMPPPPSNQIVKVSFPKGFKVQNIQYPVWVEGRFQANQVSEEVYLVDGAAEVSMGYEMEAITIEDYYEIQ